MTWSASPADESGPDGRTGVDLIIDPGAEAADHLAVRNFSNREITFAINAADGYLTPTGRFNMIPSNKKSVDAGRWITVVEAVTVPAGEIRTVPFHVTVPPNASPGDHAAGIAASIRSQGGGEGAGKLNVESRVGFRVMIRVTGSLQPQLEVQAHATFETSWNPFQPGAADLVYVLQNTGNVRLSVTGSIAHDGVRIPDSDTEAGKAVDLLPGDTHEMTIHLPRLWPVGFVSLPLALDQSMAAPDGSEQRLAPIARDVPLWAVPWPQLAILVAVGLIVVGLFWGRRRQALSVARLVREAHEEGRRAGSAAKTERVEHHE
ncbi:WxL protein peptidoglycan domain-containing protein [Specibacter sp. NPDC057265]|uniref:WxL protein peptidoglycan domain-containing protein n=1 Tax=Specibacter sp. NPDC057265 TaxID=3346075 RepID=UPI00363731A2